MKKIAEAYNLLLSKYFEEAVKPKQKIKLLQKKLIILYNLLKKWETYMNIVKASGEIINHMIVAEKAESNQEAAPPKAEEVELKAGEQITADEDATSGSEEDDQMVDLEKEETDNKEEEKKIKEEFEKIKKKSTLDTKEEDKSVKDPMQKLLSDLFTKIGIFDENNIFSY